VLAEDQSGETVQAKAKAVIIGTGGFGDDPEWIKKYTGYEQGHDLHPIRIPGLVGDGIRIAWEADAGANEMSMQLIFGMPPPYNGLGGTMLELAAFRQPNLMVNLLGERFINEEIMANTAFTGNAIARQKDHCAFTIFDGATKQHYEENGMHFTQSVEVESIDDNVKQVLDQGCPYVFVADSLEELAGKTGINADGLRKTVDEYNAVCEAGRDELFNKNPKYLRPIKQPRFYAGKFHLSAYGSLGGIRINYKLEVLNKDYEVIPGFYAVGTDVNTLYGDTYIFALPGNTMGFAVNSGRMAGENAVEYVKSLAK
jgi:fumarate reductase flavoprotein subunit